MNFYKAESFITLDNIAVRVYDRVMFQGTNWTIHRDQHWAVIGPNGSGKSTLMKVLCGQVPVIQGNITYHFSGNGQQVKRMEQIEENVSLLNPLNLLTNKNGGGATSQQAITYVSFDAQSNILGYEDPYYQTRWNSVKGRGTLTVSEYLSEQHIYRHNLYEVVETHHSPVGFETRRQHIIAQLDIDNLLSRNLVSISNGERRKVQIAAALLKQPKMLILDNPFTGLDQDFRERLRTLVAELMQDSMRVIVVITDAGDIPDGITHVLAVDGGVVIAQGKNGHIQLAANRKPQTAMPLPDDGLLPTVYDQSAKPVVEMRNVTITYDNTRILDNITWTVHEGERWALLGHNGAGKTTLLSLIMGDNPQAYANDIALFGRQRGSGESIWDIKKRIGWIAPELHLYYPKHVTCFDVVASGLFDAIGRYRRCSAEQHTIAQTWMQHLDIAQHADAHFGALSEGEQRLVLLARALVKNPALLILDEPCQGLDARNRAQIIQTVEAIGKHLETTLIYVTHEIAALPGSITHRIYLQQGKIVRQGVRSKK